MKLEIYSKIADTSALELSAYHADLHRHDLKEIANMAEGTKFVHLTRAHGTHLFRLSYIMDYLDDFSQWLHEHKHGILVVQAYDGENVEVKNIAWLQSVVSAQQVANYLNK